MIFSLPRNGPFFLNVVAAAGGANVVVPNPDASTTTFFLTLSQVRQLANAIGLAISTNFVNATINGISVTVNPPPVAAVPASPITDVIVAVPLSGGFSGMVLPTFITLTQAQQLANALGLYSVTNQ
jgi:hypothetical protein